MQKSRLGIHRWDFVMSVIILAAGLLFYASPLVRAEGEPDAALYRHLSQVAVGQGDVALFEKLNTGARGLDWTTSEEKVFAGHLRVIRVKSGDDNLDRQAVYLLRELTGNFTFWGCPKTPRSCWKVRVRPMPDSTGNSKIN